jgi:hypothetical protein
MPISYPSTFLTEKNLLESTVPFAYLIELKIRTAINPDTFSYNRVTNFNENITFNSTPFVAFPVKIGNLEQNISGELRRMSITIANVDQSIISLLELHWTSVTEPLWNVKVWLVNTAVPTDTPVTNYEEFGVVSVTTNLITATFDLKADDISLSKLVPSRNYNRISGFAGIPRKIR